MKSTTKHPLKEEQIRQIIQNYDNDQKILKFNELHDGYYNMAYSIELQDKSKLYLKIEPPKHLECLTYEKNAMAIEAGVYRLLEKDGSVPIPKLLKYDPSLTIIDREYMIIEHFNCPPWSKIRKNLTKEQNNHIWYELGKYNCRINQITGSHFGDFFELDSERQKSWKTAFLGRIEDVLKDVKRFNAKIPFGSDEILRVLDSKAEVLDDVTVPHLVHWDIWPGNIFVDKKKDDSSLYEIVAIFDFERAVWGDPLIEFIYNDQFRRVKIDLANYHKGYDPDFRWDNRSECRRRMYNIFLYLVWAIELKTRNYPFWLKGIIKLSRIYFKKDLKRIDQIKI